VTRLAQAFCGCAVILLILGDLQAQTVKGTFTGNVVDQSGAALQGARVVAKSLLTNVAATTVTDSAGSYVLPFLDSGFYSVSAEHPGFKTAAEPSVKLDIAAKVRVNFALSVGEPTETVDVSSALPLVQTDTTTVGMVITNEKLNQLPLLGRNYQELAQLAPTAVAPTISNMAIFKSGSLTAGNYFQVGGQRGTYISYTADGVDNQDLWWQSQALLQSVDSIQEFNVQSHNFSAEYGRGAVQFTTTTRSGTNNLHGSVYDYLQNSSLNANGYFDNLANRPKQPFKDNQFGVTIGGPVVLPRIYNGRDRTFFFAGYEGRRRRESVTGFANWPEPEWLQGNFAGLTNDDGTPRLIYDPASTQPDGAGGFIRTPFPGNIIPSDRFDPIALAALQYIPQPNAPGIRPGSNYVGTTRTEQDVNYWVARLDHNISQNDRLYGRYMQSRENGVFTSLAPLSGRIVRNNAYNFMVGEIHTFSTNVLNELRLGYNRADYLPFQEGSEGVCITPCEEINYSQQFGLKNLTTNPAQFGLPNFSWSGFTAIGGPGGNPLGGLTETYHLADNLTISSGRHSIKTGFDIRKQRFNEVAGFGSRGSFGFSNNFTSLPGSAPTSGSPFADFLLGLSTNAAGLTGDTEARLRGWSYGFYLQDDWRITDRLTVNMGLRYENYRPWVEENGKIPKFDYAFPQGSCFGDSCPPGRFIPTEIGESWYNPDNNNWGPRIGIAYSPFRNNSTVIRAAFGIFYSPTDMNELVNGIFNPPNALSFNVTPQDLFTDLTTSKLSNLFPGGVLPPRDAVLSTDEWTLPAVSPYPYFQDNKDAAVNQWQFSVQHSPWADLVFEVGYVGSHAYNGQRRIDLNQARLDLPGELTPVASRRPYPSLVNFTANEHSAVTNYNAGFVRAERRFSKGFTFTSSYTFAKTLDDSGNADPPPQNAYDKRAEYGLSLFHAKHRFTFGYVWELPFGRGKWLASQSGAVIDAIIGGWQVSGITTFQSGSPFNLFPCCIDYSNTGQYFFALRPNVNGPVEYLDIRETGGQYFDPSVFSIPELGTFGNAGRGVTIGPGINNWDVSILKRFRLAETMNLQFRTDFFNAFNHAQFTSPYPLIGPGLAQAGRVTATRPPRRIQLSLRLEF
jgi:hypothetical protein